MATILSGEIRHAVRSLRRSPGFTVTSVSLLALAIGANTAMFSVLEAVLFRPLPFPSPEQLVMLWTGIPNQNIREGRSSYWNVAEWRRQSTSFAAIAVFDPVTATLTRTGGAERISAARVSPNLFSVLGIQPSLGRVFSDVEAEQRQRLALISHGFFQTHFGGSPGAIGATIELDGAPSRVIGVLPRDFDFPQLDAAVFEPHTLFPDWESLRGTRGLGSWFVLGRLRPNVTVENAQNEMNLVARRLDAVLSASDQNRDISLVPLRQHLTGPRPRLALWMLAGAIFCVLLIAASNVAGLTLARNATREREIAVRAALGATRARIARQLLVESLTLACGAGFLALGVAWWGIHLIQALEPAGLALTEAGLNPLVLALASAVCLLTGVLAGLAPALAMARGTSLLAGREGGRAVAGGIAARGLRRTLVVFEFALAIMLLTGASLLIRSLHSASTVDPGFQPERVLTAQLSSPPFRTIAQRTGLYQRILEEIQALPGVESAGLIENLFIGASPGQMITTDSAGVTMSGHLRFRNDAVSPGFFKTIGTQLLKGRDLSIADGPHTPRVAVINDAMARRLWPGTDPLGRRFKPGSSDSASEWITVVGVAGDMRRQGLELDPIPQYFEPLAQDPPRLATLLVRTPLDDPMAMAATVRTAVQRVDKHTPVYDVTALENRLDGFLTARRFQTSLLIGFAVVAVLMAALGIYGLIHYSVTARTREIGIRLAVGARTGDVFRMILLEGFKLSLSGLALGLPGAFALAHAASSLLFGVTAADPVTYLAVSLVLAAAAGAACYLPARRAMKIEPIVALRQE